MAGSEADNPPHGTARTEVYGSTLSTQSAVVSDARLRGMSDRTEASRTKAYHEEIS